MNPFPVEPKPTLVFSIRTLSFTLNGKELDVLNPTERITVTFWFVLLYEIVLIPTPFVFCIGKIIGGTLLMPYVFLRIVTLLSPRLYFMSISGTKLLVFPSIELLQQPFQKLLVLLRLKQLMMIYSHFF